MVEEGQDDRRIEILDTDGCRLDTMGLMNKSQEQPKRVSVGGESSGAGMFLDDAGAVVFDDAGAVAGGNGEDGGGNSCIGNAEMVAAWGDADFKFPPATAPA